MILLRDKDIYVGKSDKEGYGVFAKNKIKMNHVLMECPFIPLHSSPSYPVTNILFLLNRAENIDEYPHLKNRNAIVLGFGSIFNTALRVSDRNAEWVVRPELGLFEYYATKNIEPDEEILVYYGKEWFESRNISDV